MSGPHFNPVSSKSGLENVCQTAYSRGGLGIMIYNVVTSKLKNFPLTPETKIEIFELGQREPNFFVAKISCPGIKGRTIWTYCPPETVEQYMMSGVEELVDWTAENEFEGVPNILLPYIQEMAQRHGGKLEEHGPMGLYSIPIKQALEIQYSEKDAIVYEGFDSIQVATDRNGSEIESRRMQDIWGAKHKYEAEFLANHLVSHGSARVYLQSLAPSAKQKRLVSWVIPLAFGSIHDLQTEKDFQRYGYGSLAMKAISKMAAKEGWIPAIQIYGDNGESQRLNERVGYRRNHDITLIYYQPPKLEMEPNTDISQEMTNNYDNHSDTVKEKTSIIQILVSQPSDEEPIESTTFLEQVVLEDQQQSVQKGKIARGSKIIPYVGLILALVSAVMSSLNNLMFKFLLPTVHPFNVCFWTYLVSSFFPAAFIITRAKLKGNKRKLNDGNESSWDFSELTMIWAKRKRFGLVLTRAVATVAAIILLLFSITFISMADALVIVATSTTVVSIYGYFCFKEACGLVHILSTLMAFAGVVCIVRPPFFTGQQNFEPGILIGTGIAIGCMLVLSVAILCARRLQKVHHTVLNLTLYIVGITVSLLFALIYGVISAPVSWSEVGWIFTSGVLGFLSQTFFAIAIQMEQAGPVTLLRNSEAMFAYLWQFLFLNSAPHFLSIIGACLILSGVVSIIMRRWISSLDENHKLRKFCSCFLK